MLRTAFRHPREERLTGLIDLNPNNNLNLFFHSRKSGAGRLDYFFLTHRLHKIL